MRRTESKMKSKGIRAKNFSNAHACKGIKYDRHYVARKYGDAKRLPFSRGSWIRYADWDWNPRVYNCLYGFLCKQVGKTVDVVFHHFCKLGWKNSEAMYYYWHWIVDDGLKPYTRNGDLYISENGLLLCNEQDAIYQGNLVLAKKK